jgi:hypothetical protein
MVRACGVVQEGDAWANAAAGRITRPAASNEVRIR